MLSILKSEDIQLFESKILDLLVESYSTEPRTLQIRGFTRNSQIIFDQITNTARTLVSSVVDITEIPIGLTVTSASTNIKRGEHYVKVSLRLDKVVIMILCSGYVTDTNIPAFPNGINESPLSGQGLIKSISGTNPAAGIEISETIPTGTRARLLTGNMTLVTDSTVADRYPTLIIDDGTNILFQSDPAAAQAASLTKTYQATPGGHGKTGILNTNEWGLPSYILLKGGYRIKTVTNGIQAGDNWSAPLYQVEQWLEV